MHFTLKGKIALAHPYQLDTTLTMEGAGAEAEATGKAIAAAQKIAEDHKKEIENPHKVTKEQVGLDKVDNTPDSEKPISTLQAEAIAEAKKAGTDAQTAAENAQKDANTAKFAADNAANAAVAAKATADKKVSKLSTRITLPQGNWAENKQTVAVEGVTEDCDVVVSAANDSYYVYAEYMIHCTEQGEGTLTFTCKEIPLYDVFVNVLILT